MGSNQDAAPDTGSTTEPPAGAATERPEVKIIGAEFLLVPPRLIWRNSDEYARFAKHRRWFYLGTTLLVVIALGIVLVLYSLDPNNFDIGLAMFQVLFDAFLVYCISAFVIEWLERRSRGDFEERRRWGLANKIGDEEKKIANDAINGKMDLPSLWAINQDRIRFYHGVAQTQAENSYKMAQLAGLAGFGAVLALGVLAAFASNGTASIAAAAVGVAGAAMSAYIGATFMKIQAQASSQFRQFFQQPVEFSRLLGAERLINTLDDPQDKAKAVQVVLAAMMSPATDSRTANNSKAPGKRPRAKREATPAEPPAS